MNPCRALLIVLALLGGLPAAAGDDAPPARLAVGVGKSLVVDSPVTLERISLANAEVAEAVAVNPREVLINGKAPGETSLILWQRGGGRVMYDVAVMQNPARVESARRQLSRELADRNVTLAFENDTAFLRGTVPDLVSAERAAAIAGTLGKVINLLRVEVPPPEAQILLRVRFANVDRAASSELGANLLSTGALNTYGAVTTGQFTPPKIDVQGRTASFTLADALNLFLFRPDLNLGATIKALENRRLLEILAEPNVLASNGKEASFVAGGEFPFPTLQGGGAGLGAVTIQFREFGVRIHFRPTITPRGSIRLEVTPEVSSLDYSNGLVFQGFNIPALATRRAQTEVELEDGQSFVIAGLLDNRVTDSLSKIPGLANIPLLGKIFQSRSLTRNNTELMVLITPERVKPIPAGTTPPQVANPIEFLKGGARQAPRTPGANVTGPIPAPARQQTLPVEQLREEHKAAPTPSLPPVQFVPVPVVPPPTPPANPGLTPTSPENSGTGR